MPWWRDLTAGAEGSDARVREADLHLLGHAVTVNGRLSQVDVSAATTVIGPTEAASTAGMTVTDAAPQAREVLERFALSAVAQRQFRQLSGGEAQRLMLARAAASTPSLLLVDEPTAQLDRATARTVDSVLTQAVSAGTIVIVATHDAETRDACDVSLDVSRLPTEESRADARVSARP